MSSTEDTPTGNDASTSSPSDTPSTAPRMMKGGCLCKAVQYTIEREKCQEQMSMAVCHCDTCQHLTSSAFSIGLIVPGNAFTLLDPTNVGRTYETQIPNPPVTQRVLFCSKCGCYLFHEIGALPGVLRLFTGTLDPASKGFVARPGNEIHVKTRIPWMPVIPGARQIQDYGQWPQNWQ